MFQSLSKKIGFTETEIKVILFLLFFLLIGFGYSTFFDNTPSSTAGIFDYSEQDSLFVLYSGLSNTPSVEDDSIESLAEVKQQVLGLSGESSYRSEKKVLPEEKSININTATIDELTQLPGIGVKTAEKIIELRDGKGSFKKLDELMEVKGIGEVKFNNIKKFLYIK